MFSVVKSWSNQGKPGKRKIVITNGRTWTRRIQWLEDDGNNQIKLKLDGEVYREVITDLTSAKVVWERFKQGQSIDDCLSIFSQEVPPHLVSRKASDK